MDRNVVIATVLVAIIMFVWLWVFAPPQPTVPAGDPAVQEELAEDSQATERTTTGGAPLAPGSGDVLSGEELLATEAVTRDTSLVAALAGEARFITVDTDLYRAVFSTKGATLISFSLKEYRKFDQETPVQMVDTTGSGALGIAFTTPRSHLVDTRALYFDTSYEGDTLHVGAEPAMLHFETGIQGGVLRQTYTFHPGEYEIGLRVDQENAAAFSTREGYELIWTGAIPFTENDTNEEAKAAGAYARSGGEVENVLLRKEDFGEQRLSGNVTWTAIKTRYFTSVMIPSSGTRGAELIGEQTGEPGSEGFRQDYDMRLLMAQPEDGPDEFRLYIGPMEFYRINDYDLGLYDMVDYGWDFFEWITRPLARLVFIPAFTFLAKFIPGYGYVIIVFAILIKLALYPLTKSSYKSMARMRELQPKMEVIKEKYGDNPRKQQEEMMKMYKETGVNPVGGCLPMLLQYPIIIALWLFLPQSIQIRQQGFLWANDLSAPDVILNLPFTIPFYGDFVAGFTLLMGISMIVQMRIQMTPSSNPQMKIITYVMPVMIFAIFNRFASGLSLYYLVYNVVTAVQQKVINRHIADAKEEENGEPAPKGRGKKQVDGRKRSRQALARTGKAKAGRRRPGGPRTTGRRK
ncbi:MAG: membrane protein insertase YidC [Bacteroidetes bacterium SB0662_bin_6]|nr:membrane protein insertase YidC [Bacteroidetes bacterium SB0668_bin_1]MYE04006.1 membrane protein insertase YidC [Bacteroidetes bacterium SB0662_bin_6]